MSGAVEDEASDVRAEDSFDLTAVDAWLKARVDGLAGTPVVKQFPGGASNLTYQLSYPGRDLILRRPPSGHIPKSGHDMHREFNVQSKLKPVFPYVPTMVAFCDDHAVLGCDFYVMDRIRGIIMRSNLPSGMTLDAPGARALSTSFIERLVELHAVDAQAAGLADLGRGGGYVERQVSGWAKRYSVVRTRNVPSFKKVIAWLEANRPPDVGSCLIHNDWRLDNVVLDSDDPQKIIGVLDWEMATIGDPLMELGCAMAYWIEDGDDRIAQMFRRQPTNLPGMLTRREIVELYAERSGLAVDAWNFYEVYGLFRLAGIIQQIYFRYHNKETTNPAFKRFWIATNWLHWRARRVIRRA